MYNWFFRGSPTVQTNEQFFERGLHRGPKSDARQDEHGRASQAENPTENPDGHGVLSWEVGPLRWLLRVDFYLKPYHFFLIIDSCFVCVL